MAALIGGTTVHGWGKVPVNATQLFQAAGNMVMAQNVMLSGRGVKVEFRMFEFKVFNKAMEPVLCE